MILFNKNITLLNLLKQIEKWGYIILTYDEAEKLLRINPMIVDEYYFTYFMGYKKYFIYNSINNGTTLKTQLELFLKDIIKLKEAL